VGTKPTKCVLLCQRKKDGPEGLQTAGDFQYSNEFQLFMYLFPRERERVTIGDILDVHLMGQH